MKQKVVQTIRTKSREQWAETAIERWTELRIWLQEHGELALVAGFVLGILAVLAYPLMLILILVLAVLAAIVWFVAQPLDESVEEGSGTSFSREPFSPSSSTLDSSYSSVATPNMRPGESSLSGSFGGAVPPSSAVPPSDERTNHVVTPSGPEDPLAGLEKKTGENS